ncbi:hypothetical protein [Paenibacillus harenae]|uniref:hypothetical protein n=1 Tax=Paenibacillus harenae TaxID=306543 RepID=UPI00048B8B2F|nr:hypothetical protein [Paenibacillus harenae]
MIKINSLPEFEELKASSGFITIVDTPTKSVKVHAASCPHVNSAHYAKKVIDGKEKNGRYYWTETVHEAISELHAEPCSYAGR